jgi:hypothetical protein
MKKIAVHVSVFFYVNHVLVDIRNESTDAGS